MIKYWQPNMNNVKAAQAHKEPVRASHVVSRIFNPPLLARTLTRPTPPQVRGLSFAPTDLKFCSCSDDTTIKARCAVSPPSPARAGWTR